LNVVIDASARVEIVANTRRGRALARLLPSDALGWVPEHFYAEVLGVVRRRLLVDEAISEDEANAAVARLQRWSLQRASVAPLIQDAWRYRHNLTAADAIYVALAEHLSASLLTDDQKLASAPTLPKTVPVLHL
jgi:predicted nucleic acid-binding protein